MKYIIRWFESVIELVITITLTIMYVIRLVKYTILYKLNKFDVCSYKQYGCNITYDYCCKCVRYGLISTDGAASVFDNFVGNMNKNS
jgi:hypothetical protein